MQYFTVHLGRCVPVKQIETGLKVLVRLEWGVEGAEEEVVEVKNAKINTEVALVLKTGRKGSLEVVDEVEVEAVEASQEVVKQVCSHLLST